MFRTLAPLDSGRGQRKARDTKFAWILRLLRRWWVLSTCGRREFEMFFVRLGFCKERKSSRISALTIASKLRKHTSSSDSCFCARNDLFKRVHHRTKTHKVSDVLGGQKFSPPRYLILPKTHTQTHIVRALRELRCRCSFAYHLRCSSSFFFYPHAFKRSRRRQEQRDVPRAVRNFSCV
jgi:hypothetical protein